MVKLARKEQCITLYPLTTRYSLGPFPAQVNFRPSEGPFILGLICSIRLLTARYVIFCLWAKFSPSLQSGRLWTVSLLGHFHSITKYGLLTARYGQPIKRTVSTLARLQPIKGPYKAHR